MSSARPKPFAAQYWVRSSEKYDLSYRAIAKTGTLLDRTPFNDLKPWLPFRGATRTWPR
jgi:hypothetical protein